VKILPEDENENQNQAKENNGGAQDVSETSPITTETTAIRIM